MEYISIGKKSIKHQIDGLSQLHELIGEKFATLVAKILSIKGRIIISGIGKSGHVGKKLAATLSSTGTPAIFIHPAEASHGDLGMITKDDLVIALSNSGETSELQSILDYCARFEIFLAAITSNLDSTLSKVANITIAIPKIPESFNLPAPTTSSTMMLVLGDAIAITLMKARNFTEDDFKIFHPGGNLGARLKKVQDVMHKDIELPLIYDTADLKQAIKIMTEKGLGCIGVVNKDYALIGMLTDGDIRRNANILEKASLKEVMTANPITTTADEFLSKVANKMHNKKITNMFVLGNGKPIGIIHIHDLLKAGAL